MTLNAENSRKRGGKGTDRVTKRMGQFLSVKERAANPTFDTSQVQLQHKAVSTLGIWEENTIGWGSSIRPRTPSRELQAWGSLRSLRLSSSNHYSSESWVKGTLLPSVRFVSSNCCDGIDPPRRAVLTVSVVNLVVFVLLASSVLFVVRRDGPIRFALVSPLLIE